MFGRAVLVAAVVALAALAGCSSTDDAQDLTKLPNGKYRVSIQPDNTLSPAHGRVPVGATVEWLNNGGVHDITEDSQPPTWSSDDRPGNDTKLHFGETFEHTFSAPGTYHYRCSLHAMMGMRGTITVV